MERHSEQNLSLPIQALREAGQEIDDGLLQYLSPLGWEPINLTGDYVWPQNRPTTDKPFRLLRVDSQA